MHTNLLSFVPLLKKSQVCVGFGGDGNIEACFSELREIFSVYSGFVENYFVYCARLLSPYSRDRRAGKLYSKGLDEIAPGREIYPDFTYLVSAIVFFPLIGLVQLAHYYAICKIIPKELGELREGLTGTIGYYRGIVATRAIASASTWDPFHQVRHIHHPSLD